MNDPKKTGGEERDYDSAILPGRGFVPLFPYIIFKDSKDGFCASCGITILALIFFGYFKSKVTGQPLIKGTIKVAMTGIIAAAAAYLLAKAVS